jgi:hypothetical protein
LVPQQVNLKGIFSFLSICRFFLGKNKVMQIALGKDAESEFKAKLHEISQVYAGTHVLTW